METTTLGFDDAAAATAAVAVLRHVFRPGVLLPMRAVEGTRGSVLVVRSPAHTSICATELTMAQLAAASHDIVMLPGRLLAAGLEFSRPCPLDALCAWNGAVWLSPLALPHLRACGGNDQPVAEALRANAWHALRLVAELNDVGPDADGILVASAMLAVGGMAQALWDFAAGGARAATMPPEYTISAFGGGGQLGGDNASFS
jgi:hypothetical protein